MNELLKLLTNIKLTEPEIKKIQLGVLNQFSEIVEDVDLSNYVTKSILEKCLIAIYNELDQRLKIIKEDDKVRTDCVDFVRLRDQAAPGELGEGIEHNLYIKNGEIMFENIIPDEINNFTVKDKVTTKKLIIT